jgi:peptide/nickel transport system substrate-binding protein
MESQDSFDELVQQYRDEGISRRKFFAKAAALGISLTFAGRVLAACGGGGSETVSSGGKPVTGGVLHEGYDRDITRIDPVNGFWSDPAMWPAVHETLVVADPKKPRSYAPMLAEKWEISNNGMEWRFMVPAGLKFQSGAPCDASAVAAALNQIREEGTLSNFWEPVTAAVAESPAVVKLTMAHPYYDFLSVISALGFSAIPNVKARAKLAENYGVTAADGTGPFELSEFVPGSHCTVKRWEKYPGPRVPFFSNKGKAYLEKVQWDVLIEPATRTAEIETGTVDALHAPAPQDVDRLKANPELVVIEYPEQSVYQLGLNFKRMDLGFNDVRVRRAFSHAIDRDQIVSAVFFGKANPAYTLFQTGDPYYPHDIEEELKEASTFDPEMAESLLDEAGWKPGSGGVRQRNGKPLEFETVVESETNQKNTAAAIQAMLKDVGIKMNFTTFGPTYTEEFLAGPDAYLFRNLYPQGVDGALVAVATAAQPPKCCNVSFVDLPELDRALVNWQTATDNEGLLGAARAVARIGAEQQPLINVVTPFSVWVVRKSVHNYSPTPLNLYPFYNDVWIQS